MNKFIIVGGPTATGKTDAAISIAKQLNGELINADSRQVYRYLSIGTNKGDVKNGTIEGIPLHLVDVANPDERFSVFTFKKLAETLLGEIRARGKLPIIVGGTGLYIDALVKNYGLVDEEHTEISREAPEKLTISELQEKLTQVAPDALSTLNKSDLVNPRRLVRLIEKSGTSKVQNIPQPRTDYVFLYPDYVWEQLKRKIEIRVDQMFDTSQRTIIDEVNHVLSLGYSESSVALQGIGYKEVLTHLHGTLTLEECIELVKTSHKQYARRQRTWFEGEGRGYKLNVMNFEHPNIELIEKLIYS